MNINSNFFSHLHVLTQIRNKKNTFINLLFHNNNIYI
jgi:hypothetical protein